MTITDPATTLAAHPVHGPNRLKLGVFGANGTGTVMSKHPNRHDPSWPELRAIGGIADRAGIEAIVPYSRWHGFGDAHHYSGRSVDPFVFAASLAATTERPALFSTTHVQTAHPIVAAKQGASIDQVSNGRFALNVVVGWFLPEIEMFGFRDFDPARRYDYAEEWMTIVERLWTEEDGFDYDGEFFQLRDAMLAPKPIRTPRPPIMNAGSSGRGREFAARHADVAFIMIPDPTPSVVAEQVSSYKRFARETEGRDIQVWAHALVVQGASKADAQRRYDEYTKTHEDAEAVDLFVRFQVQNHAQTAPEVLQAVREAAIAGGGVPLFGTPDDIADGLASLSAAGVDGVLTVHLDYGRDLAEFTRDVVPLLEGAGLRESTAAADA